MERTAAVERKVAAEPMRLPAAVSLAQVDAEGAVRALRALMAVVERVVAARRGLEEVDDRRCPRQEQAAYVP